MGFPRGKDAVALSALLAAALLGGWMTLHARVRPFTDWTDGERSFSTTTDARIRHAVWDAPAPLSGVEGQAGEPTLAPDGHWLVFSAGARGLNRSVQGQQIRSLSDQVNRIDDGADLGCPFSHLTHDSR